jgi:hypothetical protein
LVFRVVKIGGMLTLTGGFIFIVLLLVVFGVFIIKMLLQQNTPVTNYVAIVGPILFHRVKQHQGEAAAGRNLAMIRTL